MRITRSQLRELISEAMEFSHDQIVQFLTDNATSYHNDPALDPGSIEELLLDDFIDKIGPQADIGDYKGLISSLSQPGGGAKSPLEELDEAFRSYLDVYKRVAGRASGDQKMMASLWDLITRQVNELINEESFRAHGRMHLGTTVERKPRVFK